MRLVLALVVLTGCGSANPCGVETWSRTRADNFCAKQSSTFKFAYQVIPTSDGASVECAQFCSSSDDCSGSRCGPLDGRSGFTDATWSIAAACARPMTATYKVDGSACTF